MGMGAEYGQEEAYEAAEVDLQMDIERMAELYPLAKAAPTGSTIQCPVCLREFKKRHPKQVFDNRKCKDRYWNLTDPIRRERAKRYVEGDINET